MSIRPLAPRADFPLLAGDPALHYLDSAATAQKPRVVLDAIVEYYERDNANPHRGAYALSVAATEAYQNARDTVARFLGASDPDTLIFTRGTTESLNLLATAWGRANVRAGDRIVVTRLEHHANFVPWQQLALAVGRGVQDLRTHAGTARWTWRSSGSSSRPEPRSSRSGTCRTRSAR